MFILVLETSTTSAKALIYDTKTLTYQWESEPFDKSYLDVGLHHPKKVYEATIDVAHHLLQKIKFKHRIDVISIVTTWHSLILANQQGEHLSPCYLWSNQIGQAYLDHSIDHLKMYLKTGCVPSSMYPFYKLHKLRDDQQLNNHVMVLDQGSYNYYQLTHQFLTTAEMASGTGLFNSEEASYDNELLSLIGINSEQLPRLYQGEKHHISLSNSHKLSAYINEKTLVLPAMPDGAMNQLGSVGYDLNKMTISVGTSGALRVANQNHLYAKDISTWSYCLNNNALIGAATSGACNCIDDVKKDLFSTKSYADIEVMLNENESNLHGQTMFLPFTYGERSPGFNNHRTSGFVNDMSSNIDLYRCALEGVLFNLYQCFLDVCKLVGSPIEIHLSGGILNSDYWTQMCSDIFNVPIIVDEVLHSSMYGGVVFSFSQMGLDTTKLFDSSHKTILPNVKLRDYYDRRFQVYLDTYKQG